MKTRSSHYFDEICGFSIFCAFYRESSLLPIASIHSAFGLFLASWRIIHFKLYLQETSQSLLCRLHILQKEAIYGFITAGSVTKSSKRWKSGMSAWCISSRAALVTWQDKAQAWQHTGKVHQVTSSEKFRNTPEVKILQDHLTHLSKIQWAVEKEQGTKQLGWGFESILHNLFPVLWLIWSNMTIQVLGKCTDQWQASPASWLLW